MALAVMAASSNKPASASKVKKAPQKMDSKKAFEIPGLQARPYHDDELQVAFEIIDLDRHGEIGATDLRRALQLCGEPEPTDAEIQEMIRLMDPDGSGSIEFAEFRRYFVEPPPLFRNFDLHRRGGFGEAPDEEEEEEPPPPDTLALVDGGDATPALARLESRKKKFTLKEHAEGDPRAPYVKELAKHGITPEFIRDVYQTFVEIDTKDTGFMSFEAFCKVFSKKPSPEMREIFDAFDADREGELDLRQFVIGLSTFAKTGLEEKVRFAFMMYDEEQDGSVSREELSEMLRAMAPYLRSAHRDAHLERVYALHSLHPNSRVSFDELMDYLVENQDLIIPPKKKKKKKRDEEQEQDFV
ncbi:unnamed protein product [Durusdinium trenchii]|uniref:EF-hand domain-containing protein n=1 Tax=Durusdinium trenchii TaxID=1381693 RepID=A0ABP0QR01_9DINO